MQGDSPVPKATEVIQIIVLELSQRCQCDFDADLISSAGFTCFPQSPTAVTFRALMTGSPQVAAQQLAIFLEDWTSSGAFFTVQAQLLSADGSCDVAISSPGEMECMSEPTPDTTAGGINSTLIGSVVTAAALIILVAAVIIIIVVVVKRRQRKFKLPVLPPLPIQP